MSDECSVKCIPQGEFLFLRGGTQNSVHAHFWHFSLSFLFSGVCSK